MNTSKISWFLTVTTVFLFGALIADAAFAQGGRPGGGPGGRGGHGWSGNGWHGGVRQAPSGWRGGGGWNRGPRVGIYLGAPIGFRYGYGAGFYGSPYYGSSYYGMPFYYPPVSAYPVVQPTPVVYMEQGEVQQEVAPQEAQNDSSQEEQGAWWYYCVDAKGYYPYVNECPGGWLRVAPQPTPVSADQPASGNPPAVPGNLVPVNLEKSPVP